MSEKRINDWTDNRRRVFSEREFQSQLRESRRGSLHHLAKEIAAVVAVDSRPTEKLRVIECVEGFQAELQGHSFADSEILQQRQIEIELPGPENVRREALPGVPSAFGAKSEALK